MANLCSCLFGEKCSIGEKELRLLIERGELTKISKISIETSSIPFLDIFLRRFRARHRHARKLRKILPRIAAEQSAQHVICEETFEMGLDLNEFIRQTYSFLARVVKGDQSQKTVEKRGEDKVHTR